MKSGLAAKLAQICGADNVITDPQELRTYECDGLTAHRCSPGLVVLPETAEQVAAIVRECADAKIPFVARGSGTGLSGGALPRSDGVLIVMAKMRRILSVDVASRRSRNTACSTRPTRRVR
jgi:glycolate oxidase